MDVSVIIPVYNGAAFVGEAIESALGQRLAPAEVIVVDDGSADHTPQVVHSFGTHVRYVHQPNRGPAAARNNGLSLAQGELIALLDADDIWHADKLAIQTAQLAREPYDIVLGHMQFMTKEVGRLMQLQGEPVPQLFLGSALFRREVFEEVGRFDETLYYCDDWDWFMRAREANVPMQMFPNVVMYYRRHDSNITRSPQSRRELLHLLQKSLKRRRANGMEAVSMPDWFDAGQRLSAS